MKLKENFKFALEIKHELSGFSPFLSAVHNVSEVDIMSKILILGSSSGKTISFAVSAVKSDLR